MSIFSKLFGSTKKDATYTGSRPPSTSTNLPGGQEYYQTLKDRLAGNNVGFGDSYASHYANPITANMRNQFQTQQIPALQDELSASGRRRSSTGFDQIQKAYAQEGLNEGDVFSRLQQRNEDQKRQEINAALEGAGNLGQREAGLLTNFANFDKGINDQQVQREDARVANESAGYKNLAYAGSDLISSMYGGGQGLGMRTGQASTASSGLNYGGQQYPITAPPANYDYSNMMSRYASKAGQRGRAF